MYKLRFFPVLAFLLSSTPALATPDANEIENYLQDRLPAQLNISHFRHRVFEGDAGTGRVSITGEARLTTSLFARVTRELYLRDAKRAGEGEPIGEVEGVSGPPQLTAANIRDGYHQFMRELVGPRHMGTIGHYVLLRRTAEAGARIPFQYELRYRGTVDGFDFSLTDRNIDMPDGQTLQRSRSRYGDTAYVRGSAEARRVVKKIIEFATAIARSEAANAAALPRMRSNMKDFFSKELLKLSGIGEEGTPSGDIVLRNCEHVSDSTETAGYYATDYDHHWSRFSCEGEFLNDYSHSRPGQRNYIPVEKGQERTIDFYVYMPETHPDQDVIAFMCVTATEDDVVSFLNYQTSMFDAGDVVCSRRVSGDWQDDMFISSDAATLDRDLATERFDLSVLDQTDDTRGGDNTGAGSAPGSRELQEGHRIVSYNDGSTYQGEFRDGQQHGWGRYETSDGFVYEGDWKEGQFYGEGRMWYTDGSKYVGDVVKGVREGVGKVTYTNGAVYEGEWRAGKRHGKGVETNPDGTAPSVREVVASSDAESVC